MKSSGSVSDTIPLVTAFQIELIIAPATCLPLAGIPYGL